MGPIHSPPVPAGHTGAVPLGDGPPDRRRLFGRLAAMFFAGSGVLGLVTLPLPAPGSDKAATAAVYAVALALGVAVWFAPWERWPRRASLAVVPPALALIAVGNAVGGEDLHTYGVFFVVAFVWIGMAQPPRTSAALAPLVAAAYVLPLFFLPGGVGAGLASAAVTIPVCVLVGESRLTCGPAPPARPACSRQAASASTRCGARSLWMGERYPCRLASFPC
jgi:hypothetical protein